MRLCVIWVHESVVRCRGRACDDPVYLVRSTLVFQESRQSDFIIRAEDSFCMWFGTSHERREPGFFVLQAKKEIYDVKQQRLCLAQDEYNHLNNVLTTLGASRTSCKYSC